MPDRHRKKKRVTLEENKVRQTTHWDMDYLPREEVEALYGRDSSRPVEAHPSKPARQSMTPRQLGIICIAVGFGLLVLAVAAARYLSG